MRRMSFDTWLAPVLIVATLLAAPLGAQEVSTSSDSPGILSSDIAISRDAAELRLELDQGETLTLLLEADGAVRLNGERIGSYERRDALDTAWRELLQRAMDTPTGELDRVLVEWEPPQGASAVARRMDRELEAVLQSESQGVPGPAVTGDASDSIQRLNERIREMERLMEDPSTLHELEQLPALRELRRELEREVRREVRSEMSDRDWTDRWSSPWRHIVRGLGGVFSTLMAYAILVGLGFLAVFFGRKHLEGVADTARHQTLRSGLVGLAGSFLVLPAYILGLLALAISIVGIPLILVFAPLFPVALVVAAIGGYLAVAHGAGEALAERRFTGNDWFTRANSYYYVVTGVGLLLVLFLAAHIVSMAGPWLGFLEGLLLFMAVVVTWAAFTVGFGAFLISRGGTQPLGEVPEPVLDEEVPGV